jgi:hypothetical protein
MVSGLATTIGLSDTASPCILDVFFPLRQGFHQRENSLRGRDEFGIGGGVDGPEFFGQRLLPAIEFWLGFQLFDRLSDVAIMAELLLDERFQALIGISDGRLGGIGGSGHGPGGDSGDDSVGDNRGRHGGCNCATDRSRGWRKSLVMIFLGA